MRDPETNRMLGTGAIAKLAGVCAKTAARWIDKGLLGDYIRTPGGWRKCQESAVMEFLATLNEVVAR